MSLATTAGVDGKLLRIFDTIDIYEPLRTSRKNLSPFYCMNVPLRNVVS